MTVQNNFGAVANAVIQTGAILASSAGILWAMYPTMALVAYVATVQSIAAAGVFSGIVKGAVETEDTGYGLKALIGILYLVSSYQVYLIGYEVFSGIMFAHATIHVLINLFGVIKSR